MKAHYGKMILALGLLAAQCPVMAQDDGVYDMFEQQRKDKEEVQKIKQEMKGVTDSMSNAMQAMGQAEAQLEKHKVREYSLVVRDGNWELAPGVTVPCLLYSGQMPGPTIRVKEGDAVRVVVRNELKSPTSLHFHGLLLPHAVDGLPRQNAGLIGPGESYAYQFIANQPGTYWYHPQIVHSEQRIKGLAGALIIEPKNTPSTAEIDQTWIIQQWDVAKPGRAASPGARAVAPSVVTYFTVNGRSAPYIPALEVRKTQRVRLRLINNALEVCPLHLSGHKFAVTSLNGAAQNGTPVDSIALQPGDRADIEFLANNPGVWSFSSELPAQSSNAGKFPGGTACIVRYVDFKP
jgi:manganese oxidase